MLLLFLWLPVAAQPEIEVTDIEGDGWPEFVYREQVAQTPGALVVGLSQGESLEWLLRQAQRWPESRSIQSEAARRLWQDGRKEESLEFWRRAERAEDIDFRLEAARRFSETGKWGTALELLAYEGSPWLFLARGAIAREPLLERLLKRGWKLDEGSFVRGDSKAHPGPSAAETVRFARVGQKRLGLGQFEVTVPDLDLQFNLNSEAEVDRLAADLAGPEGVVENLGVSVEGRPIEAVWYGSGSQTVVYFGAFHGDEPESAEVVQQFADYLREHPELLEDRRAVLVPVVNPDGLVRQERKNSNQVDLNRNFPTSNWVSEGKETNYWGGPKPASEPETRVVIDVLERFQPDRIVSIHCPYKCVNFDGPAEQLAEAMSKENGYKVEPSIGYPTPGSFGNYSGIERKIPTITLELPPTGEEDVWKDNRDALVRALRGVD